MTAVLFILGYLVGAAIAFFVCRVLQLKGWMYKSMDDVPLYAIALTWPLSAPVFGGMALLIILLSGAGEFLSNLASKYFGNKPAVPEVNTETDYRNSPACDKCGRGNHRKT